MTAMLSPSSSRISRLGSAALVVALHGAFIYGLAHLDSVQPIAEAKAAAVVQYVNVPAPLPPVAPARQTEPPKAKPAPPKPKRLKPKPLLAAQKTATIPPKNAPEHAPKPEPKSEPAPVTPPEAKPAAPVTSDAPAEQPRADLDYLANRQPNYPSLSRRLKEQGTVLLRVRTDASGAVLELRLERSSGFSRLDEAALRAVRKWRFTPVAGEAVLPVEFSLN